MRLFALMEQLTKDACTLTLSTLRNFDRITPEPQDESQASLCKKIKKRDGEVDFSDATEVYNKYRAFEGWPGIFAANGTKFDDLSLIETVQEHQPFEIVDFEDESVIAGCKKGSLRIGTLQPVSKKPMSAKAYSVGRGLKVGDKIIS
jgi:methionyl-tRNA formyltransferase